MNTDSTQDSCKSYRYIQINAAVSIGYNENPKYPLCLELGEIQDMVGFVSVCKLLSAMGARLTDDCGFYVAWGQSKEKAQHWGYRGFTMASYIISSGLYFCTFSSRGANSCINAYRIQSLRKVPTADACITVCLCCGSHQPSNTTAIKRQTSPSSSHAMCNVFGQKQRDGGRFLHEVRL